MLETNISRKLLSKTAIAAGFLLITLFVSFSMVHDAMADSWGSTGGGGAEGSSGGEASVDCTTLTNPKCNHWIKAPIDHFKTAWNNKKGTGYSEEAFTICTDPTRNTDGFVVFAGQHDNVPSNIRLWNLYPKPSYLGRNYKLDHSTAFIADSSGRTHHNFFNDETVADKDYTYGELMSLVMKAMGLSGSDGEARLAFFCHGLINEGASLSSRSSVSAGGQTFTSTWDGAAIGNTINTNSNSVSVSFSHEIKRNDTTDVEMKTTWNISSTGSTSVTVSPPNSKTDDVFGKGASRIVHTTKNISVSVPEGGSVTVCQTIKYKPKTSENASSSGSSQACVTISRKASPTVQSCPLPNSAYSIQFGGTQAQSGVVNLTKDGVWKTTNGSSSTPAFVWAKPGDSIRFKHTLCFGAQNVRGSKDNGVSTTPPSDDVKPSTSNTATITALTKPATSGGKYLFGNSLNGGSTQSFTVPTGASKASSGRPDQSGDYWFTYYSPSNNAGDAYKCYAADRGFPQFRSNGYQIPDFTNTTKPADCNAAKKASANSDAGKIIEQNLTWNNVKAWQNTHNTTSGGSCTCSTRNAYANNTTHSYEDAANGKYTPGTRVRKCYQSSSTGCGWCSRSPSYSTRDYYYYPINTTSSAGAKQVAQVKIPFNYNTKTNVNTSQSILYGGGEYGVNVSININKRQNTEVSSSEYATISKNSVYEIVAFTVAPATSYNSIAHANDRVSGNGSKLACSYYNRGASRCLSLYRSGTVQLNDEGSLNGAVEHVFNGDLAVPDAEVGTKFCVAVGVWPSDSHNFTSGAAGSNDTALNINDGAYWNYSEPTCRTIAKKPMVQFRSEGVYTSGSIVTSQTKKSVGYNFGSNGSGNGLKSNFVNSGNRRVFGSFSEYEAIAMKTINGFASGAAFGYGPNNSGRLTSSPGLPGGYPNVKYTEDAKVCTYSTQTFSNDRCADKVIGESSINSFSSTLVNRLLSRYTSSSSASMQASGRRLDLEGTCILKDGRYQPSRDGRTVSRTTSYTCLENGAKYVKVQGDAYVQNENPSTMQNYCMGKGDKKISRTSVIDVSGTLTIDANFKYGNLGSSDCTPDTYSSIAEMPQQLIFAGDINIVGRVTNIDAWLIVGQNGSGNGTINTCSDVGNWNKLDSTKCNSKLTINGPVIAKKLILNRTAGAGVGNASIEAAEVFNLRPDAYLWAYNQSSRYSQAVTSYSRELPTRY